MYTPKFLPIHQGMEHLLQNGLIAEINRVVLHPRGLSLHVAQAEGGIHALVVSGLLVAHPKDLVGFTFTDAELANLSQIVNQPAVRAAMTQRVAARMDELGMPVQPLPPVPPAPEPLQVVDVAPDAVDAAAAALETALKGKRP